jgi:hypothetical protein
LIAASVEITARVFGFLNEADTFRQVLSDVAHSRRDLVWLCLLALGILMLLMN